MGEHPAQAWLMLEEYNQKGLKSAKRYGWNFGDLHEPSLAVKVSKDEVVVESKVRQNQDFVRIEEDGKTEFENEIAFHMEDVDKAHILVQTLQNLIPMAREASLNALPETSSFDKTLALLKEQIKSFSANEMSYEQSLSGDQIATYP